MQLTWGKSWGRCRKEEGAVQPGTLTGALRWKKGWREPLFPGQLCTGRSLAVFQVELENNPGSNPMSETHPYHLTAKRRKQVELVPWKRIVSSCLLSWTSLTCVCVGGAWEGQDITTHRLHVPELPRVETRYPHQLLRRNSDRRKRAVIPTNRLVWAVRWQVPPRLHLGCAVSRAAWRRGSGLVSTWPPPMLCPRHADTPLTNEQQAKR